MFFFFIINISIPTLYFKFLAIIYIRIFYSWIHFQIYFECFLLFIKILYFQFVKLKIFDVVKKLEKIHDNFKLLLIIIAI